MVQPYKGHYRYNEKVVGDWDSTAIGVYYCGLIRQTGKLSPLYIGKGTGDAGIRGRLLQHLNSDNWPDVTHFGYCVCSSAKEAEDFEAAEIKKHQPKYNTIGKTFNY